MKSLFSLLFLPLFLSGCGWGFSRDKEEEAVVVIQKHAGGYQEVIEKASEKIIDTQEFQECMKPTANMCIVQVGNEIARKKGSTTFCNEMPDDAARESCLYGVIRTQLASTKNIALCDQLQESYKKECRASYYDDKAIRTGNMSECDKLLSEYASGTGAASIVVGGANINARDRVEQCRYGVIMVQADITEKDCENLEAHGGRHSMCMSLIKKDGKKKIEQSSVSSGNLIHSGGISPGKIHN